MEKGLDWAAIAAANNTGDLFAYIVASIPHARWGEQNPFGSTLLHFASWGDTAATAALLQHRLDVNVRDQINWTPAHVAAYSRQAHILELLCAAGADLHAMSITHNTPLDEALGALSTSAECVRVLVANGACLALVRDKLIVQPWMVALAQGRVDCRAMIVVLLGLKWRRGQAMQALDRFVVREVAYAVWSTRTNVKWQSA